MRGLLNRNIGVTGIVILVLAMFSGFPNAAAFEEQIFSLAGTVDFNHPGTLMSILLFLVAIGGILAAVFIWNFTLTRQILRATAAIRESEARFKGIFDHAYQLFGLLDAEGNVIEANQRALEIIGATEADVKGKPFATMPWWTHNTESAALIKEMLESAIRGHFVRHEAHHRTTDGKLIHIDFSLKPITDETGRVVNIIAESRDITELKNYQRALEEQKEDYRSLFENSLAGLYRTGIEDGLFLRANDQVARIFGFETKEDIIGKVKTEGYYIDSGWRKAFMKRLLVEGEITGVKTTILSAEGLEKHFLLSAKAFPEKGYLEGSMVDITRLKRAETALLESEAKFRAIFESSPEGIGFAGFDGEILNFNRSLQEITGYSLSDLAGRRFSDITPKQYIEEENRHWKKLVSGNAEKVTFQKEIIGKHGDTIPVEVTGWLIRNENDAAVAVGGFIRDLRQERRLIEEKKALESLLQHTQKMEAIGTLAGGIAHDFNNILAGIVGHAEIALEDAQAVNAEGIQKSLGKVLAASFRAKELVSQILKFSRREEGERKSINISNIVNEVCTLMTATLPSTISFNSRIDSESAVVHVDPGQIHQVLMNLCTNAFQAIGEDATGTIEVRLTRETTPVPGKAFPAALPPGSYCRISVSDTGCGMPEEILERIFDPYFTTKAAGKGTGLGLSVSRGIIASHGGTISVKSAPGEGTEFSIFIPVSQLEEHIQPAADNAPPRGNGETILVVDDEAFFVEIAEQILSRAGYTVVARHSSLEAAAVFRKTPQRFDVIVTDQTMPELTGVQLSRKIREVNTEVPIILCTGFSETITEGTAADFSIDRVIMKPVTTLQLLTAVHQTLATRKGADHGTHTHHR